MSRKSIFVAATFAAFASSFAIGCSEAKKAPTFAGDGQEQATMKPDRVAVTRVGLTALGELSHLERAIKPFIGLKTAATAVPSEVAALDAAGGCRKTSTTNAAQWETRWACGMDVTVRGRKEVEGVERLNYDQSKRALTYKASFEIRNFEDLEPRANAHTLVVGRRIHVTFGKGASNTAAAARLRMASSASIKNLDQSREGSNWSNSITAILKRSGDTWTLDKGAVLDFKGALWGVDGERKTKFASGEFNLVSETDVSLSGLGDSDCTKPIATWQVSSTGGGGKFNTALASTLTTVFESSGGTLNWPADLCEQP